MLNNFLVSLAVGILLGYFAGLGAGGGSLLILWLTLVCNFPQNTAKTVNLMFFLAAAGATCLLKWKRQPLKPLLPAILWGCISAGIFNWIAGRLDTNWIRPLFGILLLCIGIKEICYRPRNAK